MAVDPVNEQPLSRGAQADLFRLGVDVLPSLNLVYALSDRTNLRAAYGRTLARPSFRELAPYAVFELRTNRVFLGNPDLRRTLVDNADLRFEWFSRPGEILAASVYYKRFQDPIELTYNVQAVNAEIQPRNLETRPSTAWGGWRRRPGGLDMRPACCVPVGRRQPDAGGRASTSWSPSGSGGLDGPATPAPAAGPEPVRAQPRPRLRDALGHLGRGASTTCSATASTSSRSAHARRLRAGARLARRHVRQPLVNGIELKARPRT